jgi:hypothetical protein
MTPPADLSFASDSQVQAIATMGLYYPASLYCSRFVYDLAYSVRQDLGDAIFACVETNRNATCPQVIIETHLLKGFKPATTLKPGQLFKVSVSVRTAASQGQYDNAAVVIMLPEGVMYQKSMLQPPIKGHNKKDNNAQLHNSVLYWRNAAVMPSSKTQTYTAFLKVSFPIAFGEAEGKDRLRY